jgi:hypothetical protein
MDWAFTMKAVPYGHPDFNKVYRCPNNPVEHDEERRQRLRQLSNLHAFADKRFDNFHVPTDGNEFALPGSLRETVSIAKRLHNLLADGSS